MGFVSILLGAGAGILITFIIHSSSASTAVILSMAFNNVVSYEMAASMILGANIGTTLDAALVTIGANTSAKRAALVHVLFNVIGTVWALPLIKPLLALVSLITPGSPVSGDPAITTHLAMLHTVFNLMNTVLFLPLVNQFARLVSLIIHDNGKTEESAHYSFADFSSSITDTPELNIMRVEKEIRDMAALVSTMFSRFCDALRAFRDTEDKARIVSVLIDDIKAKEEYADEMNEILTSFLIDCTREMMNERSRDRISGLLRVIANLEDMADSCYGLVVLLERSVRKDRVFKGKEMDALVPYIGLMNELLSQIGRYLGQSITSEQYKNIKEIEKEIVKSQSQLRKLGRKRIEAGENIKTELLFIEMVRSIERLGNYCSDIVSDMAQKQEAVFNLLKWRKS
jgi:phosphate:Na+ symporter